MMTSFLAQSTSVGVIALIAMFPTPDKLRQALTAPQTHLSIPKAQENVVVIDPASYEDAVLELEAPIPMTCAETQNDLVSDCAEHLVSFIDNADVRSPPGSVFDPDLVNTPAVEQAHRALTEVCRLRWAMTSPPEDAGIEAICADLN